MGYQRADLLPTWCLGSQSNRLVHSISRPDTSSDVKAQTSGNSASTTLPVSLACDLAGQAKPGRRVATVSSHKGHRRPAPTCPAPPPNRSVPGPRCPCRSRLLRSQRRAVLSFVPIPPWQGVLKFCPAIFHEAQRVSFILQHQKLATAPKRRSILAHVPTLIKGASLGQGFAHFLVEHSGLPIRRRLRIVLLHQLRSTPALFLRQGSRT
jgi:hypothetical protein